jgi:hypothetical protein
MFLIYRLFVFLANTDSVDGINNDTKDVYIMNVDA